jgi:hypothetical protein
MVRHIRDDGGEIMRILAGSIITAALVATGASAQPGRLSDVAFMEVARCAGLASSQTLGSSDGAAYKALIRSQSWGRDSFVLDKADDAQSKAKREADHADDFAKSKLTAELNGTCATLKS